jgi:acyl-CoA thioester hydrolase
VSAATISYRVPYADTDQMGVVYYANFFVYFERVRNEMLRAIGYAYREIEADGLMLPVIEANCRYRQPAHYDDVLAISGSFETIGRSRLRIACEVHRDDELLATGHTVHACVNTHSSKPCALPERLVRALPH